jgi:hypothetical protein
MCKFAGLTNAGFRLFFSKYTANQICQVDQIDVIRRKM